MAMNMDLKKHILTSFRQINIFLNLPSVTSAECSVAKPKRSFLVGGFNPSEKYEPKIVHLPQMIGVKIPKNI